MRLFLNGMIGLSILLYPLAVFFGKDYIEPWKMAGILIVSLLIRLAAGYESQRWSAPLLMAGIVYSLFAMWSNQLLALRFYPVLANGLMLIIFAWSLLSPPSLIELIARLQQPDLPPEGVLYTRRVTQIWCVFFVFNGSLAFATAVWASFEIWSLYNGLIAYLLMGILLGGEYLIRRRTQKYAK